MEKRRKPTQTRRRSPPRRPPRRSTRLTATDPASIRSTATLLQLMWLASPALPVGGFSYSDGLEAAVDAGEVTDEACAGRWLCDQLHLVLARSDLPVVAAAHDAWRRGDAQAITALNGWVGATRETHEGRQQTQQMGRSLVEWMKNRPADAGHTEALSVLASLRPAPAWPVAFALAALQGGADRRQTLLAFAFGWAENLVQAALKSVPLGQAAGQRVLSGLVGEIPAAVEAALQIGESERQVCTPMLAILSSRHETQYSRLFRS